MNSEVLLPQPSVPGGGAVLNPFVIVDDAAGLVDFVSGVFGVVENAEVRTRMPDGKLIHAQLRGLALSFGPPVEDSRALTA